MKNSLVSILVLCLLLLGTHVVLAAGFEVAEVSGRQLGSAYAGKAANIEDASTIFFNPAGMSLFKQYNLVGSIEVLISRGDWKDDNSTGSPYLGYPPLSGGDGGDPGGTTFLPNLYFVAPVMEDFAVGLGVTAPFGLKTEYDKDWQGRYNAVTSDLVVMDVMGAASYRFHEGLSFGVGVDYQAAGAELTNAVDYGTIFRGQGLTPEDYDGYAKLETDDPNYAWGWNFGVLAEFTDQIRMGVTFRSKVSHDLEGDATFKNPSEVDYILSQVPESQRAFQDTTGHARLILPEQVYISGCYDMDEQWTFLADATWTRWSRFEELRVTFDNPAQPATVQAEDWDDVWRFSIGAIYRLDEKWTFRAGAAYDQSPIPNKNRTPRIPTNDRIWLTCGVGYQINELMAVDLSYLHVFIDDGDIDQTAATGQNLDGKFEGSADVIGLQFTFSF
jgi:long-chain fatty acid transport protein